MSLQRGHLAFWDQPCYVHVVLLSARGWEDVRLTLAQFARARSFLARADVVGCTLVGDLV